MLYELSHRDSAVARTKQKPRRVLGGLEPESPLHVASELRLVVTITELRSRVLVAAGSRGAVHCE